MRIYKIIGILFIVWSVVIVDRLQPTQIFETSYAERLEQTEDLLKQRMDQGKIPIYALRFYKETWNFTRSWRPDLSKAEEDSEYIMDQIRDHYNQCIGYLRISQVGNEKNIMIHINDNGEEVYYECLPYSELEF